MNMTSRRDGHKQAQVSGVLQEDAELDRTLEVQNQSKKASLFDHFVITHAKHIP
jgi:hypothetical protein